MYVYCENRKFPGKGLTLTFGEIFTETYKKTTRIINEKHLNVMY